MKTRTVYGVLLVLAAIVVVPVLAYAAFRSQSKVDIFLEQRVALLKQLDINVMNLPPGFEHVVPPHETSSHPPKGHIESVIRRGDQWYGDNYSSNDLRIVAPYIDADPHDVLDKLFPHLATGMDVLGFTSPKSGGPDWIVENRRAAHSTWWRDSEKHLIVTISVVVDADSDSAHVTRYVHERFD